MGWEFFYIYCAPSGRGARPRASPSASARCALRLRASRGGFASGALLSSGWYARIGENRVFACPSRGADGV